MRLIDKLTVCIIAFLMSVGVEKVEAQSVAVRNNLLYDATLTPNLGVDLKIDSLWTVGAVVGINAWDYDKQKNEKWRHLLIAPNIRRWLDEEPFHKNYIEGDLIYSHFNVGNTTMPWSMPCHTLSPSSGTSMGSLVISVSPVIPAMACEPM